METKWTYGGRDYPFDVRERDCAAAITEALAGMKAAYDAIEGEDNAAVVLAAQCAMIGDFFARIFGEEAVCAICGEDVNIEAHADAYVDFICFVNGQLEALAAFRRALEEKIAARIGGLATECAV